MVDGTLWIGMVHGMVRLRNFFIILLITVHCKVNGSYQFITKRFSCNLFKNVSSNLVAVDLAIESNLRYD